MKRKALNASLCQGLLVGSSCFFQWQDQENFPTWSGLVLPACNPLCTDQEYRLDDASPLDLLGVEVAEADEVGPEPVDDGTEGEAVLPGAGHVGDADPRVAVGHPPRPHLQGFRTLHCHPQSDPSLV